jgi:hypothetical protein
MNSRIRLPLICLESWPGVELDELHIKLWHLNRLIWLIEGWLRELAMVCLAVHDQSLAIQTEYARVS